MWLKTKLEKTRKKTKLLATDAGAVLRSPIVPAAFLWEVPLDPIRAG
jgi:hypothetical protein